jgi:hypothetical protein
VALDLGFCRLVLSVALWLVVNIYIGLRKSSRYYDNDDFGPSYSDQPRRTLCARIMFLLFVTRTTSDAFSASPVPKSHDTAHIVAANLVMNCWSRICLDRTVSIKSTLWRSEQ